MSGGVVTKKTIVCVDCSNDFETEELGFCGVDLTNIRCPSCRQKARENMEQKAMAKVEFDIARRRRHFRQTCGIPKRYMNEEFGTFDKTIQPDAYKRCLKYAQKYKVEKPELDSLIISSPGINGTGKTHLVCAIAHNILNNWQGKPDRCPVHFVTEPDLFSRIRATYDKKEFLDAVMSENEQEVINYYKTVPLLIVDDVAKEEVGDPRFVQRTWFKIINGRYNNLLPIVITANKSINELRPHFSGGTGNNAISDRLIEMTNGKFVLLKGISYRPIKGRSRGE